MTMFGSDLQCYEITESMDDTNHDDTDADDAHEDSKDIDSMDEICIHASSLLHFLSRFKCYPVFHFFQGIHGTDIEPFTF